jgi:hypothetical protein
VARGLYAWLTHPLYVSVFGNFGPQYIRPPKARVKSGCRGQSHARERNVLQTERESIPLVMVQTYPIATNFQFAAQFCCNTTIRDGFGHEGPAFKIRRAGQCHALNVLYPSDEQATSKVSIKLE